MNHCREAAHFFICVYVVLLGIASVYLSVGFPCNPWADVNWTRVKYSFAPDTDLGYIVPATKVSCWKDCEAYALRLHLVLNPTLVETNTPTALVQHLLTPIQPNPFCFSPLLQSFLHMEVNPFCPGRVQDTGWVTQNKRVITQQEFKAQVRESARVHSIVVVSLCLDCIVVSLAILLIYISTLVIYRQDSQPYAMTFPIAFVAQVTSLFLSSYAASWLSCFPEGTDHRFCDGKQPVTLNNVTKNFHLPEKASGVSNFEISLIVKNINLVCIMLAGLVSFSIRRVFDRGLVIAPLPPEPDPPVVVPHRGPDHEEEIPEDNSSDENSPTDSDP